MTLRTSLLDSLLLFSGVSASLLESDENHRTNFQTTFQLTFVLHLRFL